MTASHRPLIDGAIDVHTHVVPASFPSRISAGPVNVWPSVEHGDCGHARVLVGGKPYRDIDDRCWHAERRIEGMTAMGIARQILSPMPELLSYWMTPADGRALSWYMNEQIATLVKEAPDRFIGFGTVPLQAVDQAIDELVYLTETLGLSGIEIGTNVNGKAIGDPSLEPFFAEAERRGVPIFVHPLRPTGMDRLVGPPLLEQVVAFPCETAFAIASMMTGGTLTRHPRLRIAFCHGGGTFGQMLPRLQHAWGMAPALQKALPDGPTATARKLFYDTLVYDAKALNFLADQFGIAQLMLGTDFPFAIMEKDPVGRLIEAGLDAAAVQKIAVDNPRRFLGMEAHA